MDINTARRGTWRTLWHCSTRRRRFHVVDPVPTVIVVNRIPLRRRSQTRRGLSNRGGIVHWSSSLSIVEVGLERGLFRLFGGGLF